MNNISSKLKSLNEDISIKNVPIPSTANIMSTIEIPETDSLISLPTPLLDTWIVTPSNSEERAAFQIQVYYFNNNITFYEILIMY